MSFNWLDDLEVLSEWALRSLDLKYKFIFAASPTQVMTGEGIYRALETSATLAIYEAHLSKGYLTGSTIDFERPYPKSPPKKNPKRCDLAFKNTGAGSKWAFTEVKYYGNLGKKQVQSDITKLKKIPIKSSRWMLIYRVRGTINTMPLKNLLTTNFSKSLKIQRTRSFDTHLTSGAAAICEICICQVL